MRALEDHELLAESARNESEAAFATLVERYVNLVYSTALRFTDNAQHSEEITQAVFIILARKAGSLPRGTVLSGWLYQTARLTAANFVRGEVRRQRREQEVYMQSTLNTPDDGAWQKIAPLLDEAMGQLGETDRNAVVLRYFENKTAAEAAKVLRLTEAAAQKRTNRALEKLRRIFARRGITSAVAIAGVLSAYTVQAAPAGLAVKTAATAVKGTMISATLATLVKGTMKTMTWIKYKFASGMGAAVLLAGGAATVAISQAGHGNDPLSAQEIAEKSRDAYAALSSYSDSGTVVFDMGSQQLTNAFNTRLQRPKLYRIDWTQTGGLSTTKAEVWSDGSGDYTLMGDPLGRNLPGQDAKLTKWGSLNLALSAAMPLSYSATATIPGAFFNQDLGDFVTPAASGRYPLKMEKDAKVGGVECYVLSSGMIDLSKVANIGKPGTAATTLWIGKDDFLIHRCSTTYVEKADPSATSDQGIDDAIKKSLEMQNKPATPEAIAALRPMMKQIMQKVQGSLASGLVYTQTHENISVNQPFSTADFAR